MNDDLDTFRKRQAATVEYTWDGDCHIIPNSSQERLYYSRNGLSKEITERLQKEYQGRALLSKMCRDMDIDYDTAFSATQSNDDKSSPSSICTKVRKWCGR